MHEIADAILGMAWGMQSSDGNPLANLELLSMRRCLGDRLAVLAANDLELTKLLQLEAISTISSD